jgi:hypothetical protein
MSDAKELENEFTVFYKKMSTLKVNSNESNYSKIT